MVDSNGGNHGGSIHACSNESLGNERWRILCRKFRALPFEPFAPVRDQCGILLRTVTRLRKTAGLELVPWNAIRQFRKPVRVFAREV